MGRRQGIRFKAKKKRNAHAMPHTIFFIILSFILQEKKAKACEKDDDGDGADRNDYDDVDCTSRSWYVTHNAMMRRKNDDCRRTILLTNYA